jgi:hypothetical protein
MDLVSKALVSLSKRFSLFAIAGVAALTLWPAAWGVGQQPLEPYAVASSTERAQPVAERRVTAKRVVMPSKRGADPKGGAGPEPETKKAVAKESDLPATPQPPQSQQAAPAAPQPSTQASTAPPPPSQQVVPVVPVPEPQPPPPDVWTDAEIIEGLRECVRLLAPIAAEIEVSEPLKKGECGVPAPVELKSVGGADKVEFRPAVPLNCRMVVALHKWVQQGLQPAAREMLGSPITRISSGTYSCRNRYGLANAAISEHAFANAIDISSFTTADGQTVNVLRHWGATERDIEAQRVAEAKAKAAAKVAATSPKVKVAVLPKDPEGRVLPPLPRVDQREVQRAIQTAQMKLGAKSPPPPSAASKAKAVVPSGPPPVQQPEPPLQEQFLHRLHKSACGTFQTVLGPEANDAHRDHFHLDLAQRRSKRPYCQ